MDFTEGEMETFQDWCEDNGGEFFSSVDEMRCSLGTARSVTVRDDNSALVDFGNFWPLEQIEEIDRDGDRLLLSSDSGTAHISGNEVDLEVDRFIHVTDRSNVDQICRDGLDPDKNETIVEDNPDLESLLRSTKAIDEKRPEGAPRRAKSVFLGFPMVSFDIDPEGIEGDQERLHIDPDKIDEDCQCVVNENGNEYDVHRAVKNERNVDSEVDIYWGYAEVGSVDKMRDELTRRDTGRPSPEVYCGCEIEPEAIDECSV